MYLATSGFHRLASKNRPVICQFHHDLRHCKLGPSLISIVGRRSQFDTCFETFFRAWFPFFFGGVCMGVLPRQMRKWMNHCRGLEPGVVVGNLLV